MATAYNHLRQRLTQDDLVLELRKAFEQIPDHRAKNVVHHLDEVLMSAYAIFALKYPSLLCFEQQSQSEKLNMRTLFGINKLCSDAQMRRILDELDPEHLQGLYARHFAYLRELGLLRQYRFLGKHLLLSIDGVEYFNSQQVHCDKCLDKKQRGGSINYSHSMLGAVLVHPDHREVFPIASEAIQKQDGNSKNDCELNAAKRLLDQLQIYYKDQPMVIIEDALYANEPHLERILANAWDFIVSVKPASHETLFKHFEERKNRGQVKKLIQNKTGIDHHFYWINNVPLNGKGNVRVNLLYYEEHQAKGKVKRWTWVTSLVLNAHSVFAIMRAARARWKIENETFNTLKNQGYHFDHNFGHGYKHLSNVMAIMMLLAFLIDQIIQAISTTFQKVWAEVKTKARIWEYARALFMTTVIPSFKELSIYIADAYRVQLE